MRLLIALLIAIVGVEYCFQIPLIRCSKRLVQVTGRSVSVIRSKRISDHWKEIALTRYAFVLFQHTLLLAVMLLGLFLVIVLPAILMDYLFQVERSIISIFFTPSGLFIIATVTLIYAGVRKRFK